MNVLEQLEHLLQEVEPNTDHQYILYMLWKHAHQVEWAATQPRFPLVDIRHSRITLLWEGFLPLIHADEILIALQHLLKEGVTLYLQYAPSSPTMNEAALMDELDRSVDEGDREGFIRHAKCLRGHNPGRIS